MRKPEYTDDGLWRIVSLSGQQWRLQENMSGAKGTKTFDPWAMRSPPLLRKEARELLAASQPQKVRKVGVA